jgi:hypothetical protein
MNEWKFNADHAKHLAALIQSLRPDWDLPGINDALYRAKDRGDAIEVCVGALRGSVPANRTPGVIPLDGNHWRDTVAAHVSKRAAAADKAVHCDRCGIVHTTLSPCSPPAERSHGRGAGLARKALAEALGKPELPAHLNDLAADYAGPYTEETE